VFIKCPSAKLPANFRKKGDLFKIVCLRLCETNDHDPPIHYLLSIILIYIILFKVLRIKYLFNYFKFARNKGMEVDWSENDNLPTWPNNQQIPEQPQNNQQVPEQLIMNGDEGLL
jgi:hypothetical protein